jgi:hypothetical protein
VEISGEGVRDVKVCPVGVGEAGADFGDGLTDGTLGGSEVRIAKLEVLGCAGLDGTNAWGGKLEV